QHEPVAVSAVEPVIESPAIAPDHEAPPTGEPPKVEAVKVEPVKVEAGEVQRADARPKAELPKGKLLIMSPSERISHEPPSGAPPASEAQGKRRRPAMAAGVALAPIAGALGGALAPSSMTHVADAGPAASLPANNSTLEAAVARIDADIMALKAGL